MNQLVTSEWVSFSGDASFRNDIYDNTISSVDVSLCSWSEHVSHQCHCFFLGQRDLTDSCLVLKANLRKENNM